MNNITKIRFSSHITNICSIHFLKKLLFRFLSLLFFCVQNVLPSIKYYLKYRFCSNQKGALFRNWLSIFTSNLFSVVLALLPTNKIKVLRQTCVIEKSFDIEKTLNLFKKLSIRKTNQNMCSYNTIPNRIFYFNFGPREINELNTCENLT